MRDKLRTLAISICALGTLIAVGSIAGGQAVQADGDGPQQPAINLQISPVSNRMALTPGQEVTDSFKVNNVGTSTFKYKVYAKPYSVTNDNYDLNFANESNYSQITSWVTFRAPGGEWSADPVFEIPQGGEQIIEYRVNVPQDAPGGGQYATLFAETLGSEEQVDASTGIKTSSRVGLILYGSVTGETRREGQILDYDFTRFLLDGNLAGTSKVRNTGNIDFNLNYSFEVKSLFGKTLYEDRSAVSVLPDTERRIKHEWDQTPWIGIFQLHYHITALSESRDEGAVVFKLPLIAIIVLILFLTILTIWTIIVVRKRKERKSRSEK